MKNQKHDGVISAKEIQNALVSRILGMTDKERAELYSQVFRMRLTPMLTPYMYEFIRHRNLVKDK